MHSLNFPTPDFISRKIGGPATTYFDIFDTLAEIGSRSDAGHTARLCQTGDLSGVAASDAALAKMEGYELPTAKRAWINDVAGAMPDVQAFIAGHPMAMRRRVKTESAFSPLAIIVDLTTSGGVGTHKATARGAVILALVRALSVRRAIELYVCTGLDAGYRRNASFVVARIETAPIDLSSAALALTNPRVAREVFYGHSNRAHRAAGSWPFDARVKLGRCLNSEEMAAIFAPAMPHVTETLCIPGLYIDDPCVNNPQKWLADQIAQHGPRALADA